jgi:DNA-nicking Smr family endonuclease
VGAVSLRVKSKNTTLGCTILVLSTSILIVVKTSVAESVDQRELERIVTVEVDYWMIEDQYLSNVNRAEEEHADQPETLTKIKKRLSEGESRLVQHLMDLHGLSRREFESKLGLVSEEARKQFFKKIMI